MAPILKFVAKFAALGVVLPVVFYLVSIAVPLFPNWLLQTTLVLCPPYIMFLATAACEPFDACSIKMLMLVMLFNTFLYAFLGGCIYMIVSYIRRRSGKPNQGGEA